jgi:hypothetical protein
MDEIPNKTWAGKFRLNASGRAQIFLFEGEAIELPEQLANVLGFEKTKYFFSEGVQAETSGPFPADEQKRPKKIGVLPSRLPEGGPGELLTKRKKRSKTRTPDDEGGDRGSQPSPTSGLAHPAANIVGRKRERTSPPVASSLISSVKLSEAKRFKITAARKPGIDYVVFNLYIYSSCVQPSAVGDAFVPLLRSLPVEPNRRGQHITHTYARPHYLAVNGSYLRELAFEVHHSTGELVQFETGMISLCLHFRTTN